jgi:hypothetical protein
MLRFRAVLGALSLLVGVCAAANAQTYTVASSTPVSLPISNVHAGDIVTVDGTLFSGDPNENGEGEPLVVLLPGGAFVVPNYFSPQQTSFVALQDNQAISAYIQGWDGDESAQVTFTVNAKKRYTQDEKDHFAKLSQIFGAAGGTLGAAAAICAIAPDPTVTKACAIVGGLGAGAGAILAAYYGLQAIDPFDPNYQIIFQPVLLTIPPILAQPGVTQAEADAANAWLLNEAEQVALLQAIAISINRANSASQVGDTLDETKQMQAAATYAGQLSPFVLAAAGTRAALVSAFQAAGFAPVIVGPNDIFNYEIGILFNGLTGNTLQALLDLGASADTITFVTGLLMVQDINVAAGTFPDFLNNSTQSALEQQVAADFNNFATRNGGNAGIPLKAGQMIQAQGWVMHGGAKTTFAFEAHVNGGGSLVGKLTLNDHSGVSIAASAVAHAFLTSSSTFVADGTYVADDGSTQTWTVAGNAAQQSVAISTSAGFSASGAVGGGNVTIKQ